MKSNVKLPLIPSAKVIESAFHHLKSFDQVFSENWVKYAYFCRFDPRLGEAWIKRMTVEWKSIAAMALREKNLLSSSPATMAVLLEQIQDYLIDQRERKVFELWKKNVLHGIPRARGESFLIGVYPFASKKVKNDAEYSLRSFSVHGFLGADIFINKALSHKKVRNKTALNSKLREHKLNDFISYRKEKKYSSFTVKDYLFFCDHHISARIAQLDLSKCKRVKTIGSTRSRIYVILR